MNKKIDVLIIEDDGPPRETVKEILSRLNCNFWEAERGEDALVLLEQRTFDVIILDIGLPGMNGLDVIREVRGRGGELPPIIVITGEAKPIYEDEARALGACNYFLKDRLPVQGLRDAVISATVGRDDE